MYFLLSPILTLSYWIHTNRKKAKILFKLWAHKRLSINFTLTGELWVAFPELFGVTILRDIGDGLYWFRYMIRWCQNSNPEKSNQGLYSLSRKTSYHKISWSLEVARFGFRLFQLLFNCCRYACQISVRNDHYNTQSRGFETSWDLALRRLTA